MSPACCSAVPASVLDSQVGYRHLFFRILSASDNAESIPDTNLIVAAPTAFGLFCAGLLLLISLPLPIKAFLKSDK